MTRFPIRRAGPHDAAVLTALGERTFRETFTGDNTPEDMDAYVAGAFTAERLAAELADPASTFFVATDDETGEPVGYAKLRRGVPDPSVTGPDPIEIERLYVARSMLGRGLGAALMRTCLEAAAETGHRTVWLGVWELNHRAMAFYRRWRFEPVGTHVFRVGSDDQTDVIMARAIDLAP